MRFRNGLLKRFEGYIPAVGVFDNAFIRPETIAYHNFVRVDQDLKDKRELLETWVKTEIL